MPKGLIIWIVWKRLSMRRANNLELIGQMNLLFRSVREVLYWDSKL